MTTAEIMKKMITFSNGNIHDIDHFLHVWSYAKMIGELEQIDQRRSIFLKWQRLRMILPARYAGKSMAIPMASIRKKKESH